MSHLRCPRGMGRSRPRKRSPTLQGSYPHRSGPRRPRRGPPSYLRQRWQAPPAAFVRCWARSQVPGSRLAGGRGCCERGGRRTSPWRRLHHQGRLGRCWRLAWRGEPFSLSTQYFVSRGGELTDSSGVKSLGRNFDRNCSFGCLCVACLFPPSRRRAYADRNPYTLQSEPRRDDSSEPFTSSSRESTASLSAEEMDPSREPTS
jgi:hypothetical protein